MSKYDLFRDRTKIEKDISAGNVANFIDNSLSSTTINHLRLEEDIPAVVTRNQKEGNDEIILFTHPSPDDDSYNLTVGDYIKHNNKYYLVYIRQDHPLQEKYLKYNIVECNVIIKFDNFTQYGAYFGSIRRFAETQIKTFSPMIAQFENTKPVIITANSSSIKVNTRFLAANESYRVINLDRISNNGIIYLSVEQTPYNPVTDDKANSKAVTPDPATVTVGTNALRKGQDKIVSTNSGYVSFDPTVKVVRRTMTTVTFQVPFDITSLDVTTKDTNGNFVLTQYEVV